MALSHAKAVTPPNGSIVRYAPSFNAAATGHHFGARKPITTISAFSVLAAFHKFSTWANCAGSDRGLAPTYIGRDIVGTYRITSRPRLPSYRNVLLGGLARWNDLNGRPGWLSGAVIVIIVTRRPGRSSFNHRRPGPVRPPAHPSFTQFAP